MKRLIWVLLLCLVLTGCSSGVAQDEHQKVVDELASIKAEYESYKVETQDWKQYTDIQKQGAMEVAKRENDIMILDAKKVSLEKQISDAKAQLDKLNGDIIKATGSAKTYPAGYLTAGQDFPVGRYKIYGGSSNFIVYSSYGDLMVNIILGRQFGVSEYIYRFSSGDEVQSGSSFKMIPVQ